MNSSARLSAAPTPQLDFWRRQLAGLPAPLELPADRIRPSGPVLRRAHEVLDLPDGLLAAVELIGGRHGADLPTTLLACFAALLHRYTGREDLVIGSTVSGEGLAGLLPLRVDAAGDPSFGELLGRARETMLAARAHQDLSLAELVDALQPEPDPSRHPLFQVALLPEGAVEVAEAAGLDLELAVVRSGETFLEAAYAADLFDAGMVRRLLDHFRNLLEGVAAGDGARLSELPLLSPQEREQVLAGWNRTEAEVPPAPVHELFVERARATPDAVAVSWSGGSLTYGELLRRALRLAAWLRGRGLGGEDLVALRLERSPELVTSSLGVLLSGAAYLPIDPANPPRRLEYVLRDSGASLLLTTDRLRLPDLPVEPVEVVTLESLRLEAGFSGLPDPDPADPELLPERDPDRLAFVIYTSGSTGRPKGADLLHRGLSNTIAHYGRRYVPGPGEGIALLASPGFDASAWEIWMALTGGATLHVAPPEVVASPVDLLAWYAREGVALSFAPPVLVEAMLSEPPPPGLALQCLLAGGDRLRLRPRPDCPFSVVNNYGPTEASIATTEAPVAPRSMAPDSMEDTDGAPTIGRPLDNVRVYLLDRAFHPVPVGLPGELYISGAGVARGYRGRPALTAERFIPDPFGAPGSRIYRTGDLARWLPSGEIDFLGRADYQVKIRGFRIELGEIEAVLLDHPAVREAAVLARPAESRLAAYVVLVSGASASIPELREHLAMRLPEYMVPTAWAVLESLPLSTSGKVNRRALESVPTMAAMSGEAAAAPRTQLEELLAGLFVQVLGLDEPGLGIHEDFFQLGGHSLLATRLASRVRELCGVKLGLGSIFEHPTVAQLAAWIDRQQGHGRTVPDFAPDFASSLPGPAPLSSAQQRLWFLEGLRPGTALYNLAQLFDLRGALSVPALAAAFDGVVRRHDALRTLFVSGAEGGDPVQLVCSEPLQCPPLPIVDLAALPEPARRREAERVTGEEARRPYDLERGPLVRAALLRLGPDEHRLLAGTHHIVSDGWSVGVLVRELSALYHAALAGKPSPLPPLAVQYPELAVWQRRWLTDEVVETQLAWWRQHLDGAPLILELPADRPRPLAPSLRGERLRLPLGTDLEPALATLGQRHGATPFMTLLAAFQSLLHRYTGQEDFVVGAPVAGRDRLELEALIGFFVNMLPLRATVSADTAFSRLLGGVRETVLSAFAHQDLPFDRLVEELAPKRDLSRTPLFQVAFAFQDALAGPDLDIEVTAAEVDTGVSKFDLTLLIERGPRGLDVIAEHSTDLFERATVQRMLAAFRVLVAGVLADPDTRAGEMPLLAAEERDQVVFGWNRTAAEVPERPVHRLFEERAAADPGATAITSEEGSLTYGELERRANRLAWRLRRCGVEPEVLTAVLLERSPELPVAALAALKAGGAYLPIDPAYPADRVLYILRDAGVQVLLTRAGILAGLPEVPVPADRVILLDSEAGPGEAETLPQLATDPDGDPDSDPDSLAYVIYTSGSTGAPKGTELCHRGLSNLAAWHVRTYGLTASDRTAMVAGPGFDASVWELWPPLTAGASLHVPPPDAVLSLPALLAWMAERGITVAFLPTPLAEGVLAEGIPAGMALRALLTGGDRLHLRPAPELPFALVNHYGPTESTVVTTAGRVGPEGHRAPDIGQPIANLRVHLLDRGLGPVPVGVPGELCVAGAGLARGYRNRPDLTAERFVPDPLGGPGERLYRTGDLARRLPGGEIEFLGRNDQQVKIRGNRIELGEIEAALRRHPEVREAAVLVREPGPRLAACVVLREGGEPVAETLRAFLAGSLPGAMIPSAWAFLEALPLTPNGKVDRRALSAVVPEVEPGEARDESAAPLTAMEELVAGLFSQVLDLDRAVGVSEDFFHLGGHSLLAARFAARVREVSGADVGVRSVFEHPTVAELARAVEEISQEARPDEPPLVPLAPAVREEGLPLSFAQQRLWFLESLQPGTALYNLPQVWHLRGPLSVPALNQALAEIVRRHEALRTVFAVKESGEPVQVVLPPDPFPLVELDLSELPEPEAERILSEEVRRPFDLRRGPLFRAALLCLGFEEHRLLLSMHHIVSDGVSVDLLAEELSVLYRAALEARPSPLAPLPVQVPDFAVWQRSWLAGEALGRQLAWWRERLEGAPVVLELPTDRPRPAMASLSGATERLHLGEELDAALTRVGWLGGATFFMTVLAAFQVLLHRYTAQDDLLVGSPVAGRDRAELEGLVGFFVNLVPLRARLAGDPPFSRLLAAAREAALGAFAHQEVPFERLVEELAPERDLSRAPLVQALLLVQGPPALPVLPGVEASYVQVHSDTAKFDLTLTLERNSSGIEIQVEYATGLFEAATARRLLGHFRALLRGIAAHPEARLSDLPLLDAAEWVQLSAWNDEARRGHSEGALLHELFEEQARRTPDAVALVAAGERLTYADLERRSARLAGHLGSLGVGPEVPVGVFLKRSADLVTALLGVLRSGGLYVPVDPAYPAERIAFLLEDSGCPVLLTQASLLDKLPATGAQTVLLDGDWEGEAPLSRPLPGNLAYLIYTSGSTGRPKGVAIEHRSAVTFAHWAREAFSPGELAGVIASTSVTFDLSVFEIFVTLAWGGTVFLVDNALAVPQLREQGLEQGMTPTLINTVPSAIAELLHIDGLPESVRTVNLAGEALTRALSDRVYERAATERLYNLYGPSEDTTYSTWALIERPGERSAERTPAIGRPVHDTQAYVLDPALGPLPVGVPGELYLGGRGLARGYFGRPELTADRFVPDPFAEEPGARMYRTGDRVRYRVDGEMEYLGRLDYQVKIRGFRIELGEVEAVLARHPAVGQVAVLAQDSRLVAWVAMREPVSRDSLRGWLAERLPEYMVPGQWAFVDELPLTPNGKVDRKALARRTPPEEAGASADAARNPVEELLATLFADVLGLGQPPGAREDFFHLGGHSLLAVQLASRVRAAFGVDLPVRAVFEHPTAAGLAEQIAAAAHAGRPAAPPLVRTGRTGETPLSFAQERLWFLDRFERGTSAYNLPMVFHVQGAGLRVDALAAALDGVVRRHEVLRSRFREEDGGQPVQVAEPCAVILPVVDLSGLADPAAEALRRERELAELPFELTRGPLVRSVLLRVSGDDHRLLVSMHHAASDGWSIGVLARDLSALYLGLPLPELPVRYADYAVWQRGWLAGEVLETELAWWRERLAGMPPGLDVPADHPRPSVQSYRGNVRRTVIEPRVTAALTALSRRCGATFFMTALAAFDTWLHRVTAAEDLVIGAPVANRDRVEIEGLVGFFVNTLVLRTSLAGDPGFEELLARVRTAALEAYAHQDLPFEKLVAELSPERDLSRHPLFQVSVSVQEGTRPELDLGPGLSAPGAEVGMPTSKFDFSLHLSREGEGLAAAVEYATDLFDASTVDRYLGHLSALLQGIADRPQARLSELPLLAPGEWEQLRLTWSGGEAVPLPAYTLHGLVEEHARRAPGALALDGGDAGDGQLLTYGELMARVESLARRLRGLGVGPETRVALCTGHSPELVIGLLGIMKAGGACVPLDPGHVSERLAFVLEDSGALVLATTSALTPRLPAGIPRVLLDLPSDLPEAMSDSGPDLAPVHPEQVAYVIYTSGSTGRPKGVAVPHRDAAEHCGAVILLYGLEPRDRMLQFASPAFDVSMEEVLSTLGSGATLVLREERWETETLARRVEELGITVLNLPSAVWHHWAHDAMSLAAPPASLRLIIVGGEEVLAEPARQWLRSPLGGIPVLNGYGPTETVITSTLQEVALETFEGGGASVPIGRPLPGRSAVVLDPRGNPVPVGVPGELYLGGCLARGYLNRSGLTAERFVPDPFGEPGTRLYRTGDLVRYRRDVGPTGSLEFLGRIDQQVKIRGFRVEPAEIEAALAAHPAVAAAAVLVRESGREKQLVAFVEPAGTSLLVHALVADLRAFLETRLPAWMVPAAFAVIGALPLNASGKIDRAALCRIPVEVQREESEAPQTEVEQALAEVWQEVLGIDRVGRGDHFFHLGGHSLLAMRLATRVRALFGIDLELRDFFEAPTLSGFAERVERALQPVSTPDVDLDEIGSLDDILADLDGLSEDEIRLMLLEAQREEEGSMTHTVRELEEMA